MTRKCQSIKKSDLEYQSIDELNNFLLNFFEAVILGGNEDSQVTDWVEHVEQVLSVLCFLHAEVFGKEIEIVFSLVLIVQVDHFI